jgi:DNA-binding transcriptional LysR family regulator
VEVAHRVDLLHFVIRDRDVEGLLDRHPDLEDFFQAKLVERHGKGIRLTGSGKVLARISRFFLLGLSNFQRGCLAEEQTFRIGSSATFANCFLLPTLAESAASRPGPRYDVEISEDPEIERRLHDLTLDFGVVTAATISHPLQRKPLGSWRLRLWVPKTLCRDESQALRALKDQQLPLVLASKEFASLGLAGFPSSEPRLICTSFLEAKRVLESETVAAILPDFLSPDPGHGRFLPVRAKALDAVVFQFRLAWNPRLLRLNPHAARRRDFLAESLAARLQRTTSTP